MSFINNMEEETENNKEKKLFKWETISLIVAYIVRCNITVLKLLIDSVNKLKAETQTLKALFAQSPELFCKVSKKFRKIHSKKFVPEPLF